jgi:SAM-dependent methyltransferase
MDAAAFFAREAAVAAADPGLRDRLYVVPGIIHDWLAPYGGFGGRRTLDFGCGAGEAAAGVALGYTPAEVLGVDMLPEADACDAMLRTHLGLGGAPPNLRFETVVEGEITAAKGLFDVIYSWSVFEHVERRRLDDVAAGLFARLRPGGLLFVQISPLYFSPEGSHLWALGYHNWEHLTAQPNEVRADLEARGWPDARRNALWNMFQRLNRITAPELLHRLEAAGFALLREHRVTVDREPPHVLTLAYTAEALKTEQVVLLMRRPG